RHVTQRARGPPPRARRRRQRLRGKERVRSGGAVRADRGARARVTADRRIRVLVVEDSPTVRERLCEVIASDAGLELVATAGDGRRAVELCALHRPDVITMDMMLPGMTGLEAT